MNKLRNEDKIVLFPRERERLEKEAIENFQKHNYKEALKQFNQLIAYGVQDADVNVGKVTCLAELGRLKDAEYFMEDLIEELIEEKGQDYYTYIHIYATVLFQYHKHKKVEQLLHDALKDHHLREPFKTQFQKLYGVNQPLVEEEVETETSIKRQELEEAIKQHDMITQWHLVNHLQQTPIEPYLDLFEDMLKDPFIHPVIKTVIISLLQANSIDQMITVEKFGEELEFNPIHFPFVNEHPYRKAIQKELAKVENDNPSFFKLTNQVLDRYFYVQYPLINEEASVTGTVEAILKLVSASFDHDAFDKEDLPDELVNKMNELIESEQIYFSIMED